MLPPRSARHLHGSLQGTQLADPAFDGLAQQHTSSEEKAQIGASRDSDLSRFDDADEDAEEGINGTVAAAAISRSNESSSHQGGGRKGVAKSRQAQGSAPPVVTAQPPTPAKITKMKLLTKTSSAPPTGPKAADVSSNLISEDDEKGTMEKMDTPDEANTSSRYGSDVSDTEEDPTILTDIRKPGDHDVLFGRGGLTNRHSGNVRFRNLLKEHKLRYINAWKADKPKVAREVVAIWRAMDPPGRFLAPTKTEPHLNPARGTKVLVWHDVGNKRAQEKTSQCLREKNSQIKAAEAMATLQNKVVPGVPLKPRLLGEEAKRDRFGRLIVGNAASPPPPPLPPQYQRRANQQRQSQSQPEPHPSSQPPASTTLPTLPPGIAPGVLQHAPLPPPPVGALPPEVRRILDLQERIQAARSRIESAQGRIDAQAATASLAAALSGGGAFPPLSQPGPAALAIQHEALALLQKQQVLAGARQNLGIFAHQARAAAAAQGNVTPSPPPTTALLGSTPVAAGQSHPNVAATPATAPKEAFFRGLP